MPATAATAATATAQVNPALLATLEAGGTTDFLVYLRETANLSPAASLPAAQRAQRVYSELTATANRAQLPVRELLTERKASFKPYWIVNAIWVNGSKALVEELAAHPAVSRIEPSKSYPLIQPSLGTTEATVNAIEWGISNIKAPQVWSEYGDRGQGIVVANIDSGVAFDHPALVNSYRGNVGGGTFNHNYNWFDPAGICPSPVPCDNNDHGTHTMGTMVGNDGGANQIGVAPDAKWIAAKGCELTNCSDASLLASGQWVLAPTDLNGNNPRPDLHPDIVNNSWGGGGGDPWYEATVNAWIAAGIFPMFSNGNSGPGCNTAGSPGDYPQSYAAGAYDINNNIASFSSRGKSGIDNGLKPNIAAPGANVRSSVPGGGYAAFSGTSMASPHVAGTVALIWSAAPSLKGDINATKALLDSSAIDVDATTCGGTAADNNVFGEGRLDAYAAVTNAPRGPSGTVTGTVTDTTTGTPIAGATVSSGSRTATTAANGTYSLVLSAGPQPVTAAKFGYHSQTVTVTVVDASSVTQNFALLSAPSVTVSGKVTDGSGHGWALYAAITVPGRPGGPVFTDPITGNYSFTVPGNTTYELSTSAKLPGYQTKTTSVTLTGANKVVNIALPVDVACTAPGYSVGFGTPILNETFDSLALPAGWTNVNNGGTGVWSFNDPGARGNLTGGTGGFAILDSDKAGSGNTQDASLVTPVLDLSSATSPYLKFNFDYRAFSNSIADVDVTTNGTTWTNIWHQTTTALRGPRLEQLAVNALAGAATAQIRFRYKGTWAWWWAIDNVQLLNRSCTPVLGGLVAGFTTDANTGAGLNGVTVTSGDVPAEKATSAATPDDAAIGDGFYWLFSSATGAHPFTAAKAPYTSLTKSVTVVADSVKRADFALKSARLTVSPTTVQAFQPYGSVRKTTVTVTNTGSATANVELVERGGTFELLNRPGAALVMNQVPGGKVSKSMTGVAATGTPAQAPTVVGPWTSIADYPDEVFDNAAATFDGKVYSVGGGTGSGLEKKLFVYSSETNTWAALADMPTGRAKPAAVFTGGKLYVLGGWSADGDPVATVDVFDPAAGTWSTVAGAVNPAPASAAGVGLVNGKIYLVGGCANDVCDTTTDTVIFNPATGAFSAGADYPQTVAWMSCGGIGDKVYCAGGSGSADYTNGFAYDVAADSWAPIADMPIDLWGSSGASAGGLLVLAGGVTGGSTAITNRTLAYDPAANAWIAAPNAQFALYRGAGACGAYKVGGSPSSFVGSAESEFLADLALCDEPTDIPWLSAAPTPFTLAAGKSKTVTITLTATAAAGVAQPGVYTGQLALKADTPYPVSPVDIEMNVSPPATWGKITGTVLGQSCSGATSGVKAIVRLNLISTPGVGYTLKADAQGKYAYWLPKGTYQVIVAKDGWIPEAVNAKVEAGIVRTLDFTLDPEVPCPSGV
ncbi:S8 family serine peptidase [Allocatelliglobosispora scoriae]